MPPFNFIMGGTTCSRRRSNFETALETITLTAQQKAVLQNRYIPMIRQMRSRARRLAIGFYLGHTIITVGSLIVPALLSIQYTATPSTRSSQQQEISEQIYWATWIISLFVTICNGLVTLYKVDRHYYFIHTNMEHLTSEGWQYISLTSKYSGYYTLGTTPTHGNQFIYFCHAIEKIRMRQIEEEYYKMDDKQTHDGTGTTSTGASGTATASETATTSAPSDKKETGVNAGKGATAPRVFSTTAFLPPTPLKGDLAAIPAQYRRAAQMVAATSIQEDYADDELTEEEIDGASTNAAQTSPTSQGDKGDKENKEDGAPASVPV